MDFASHRRRGVQGAGSGSGWDGVRQGEEDGAGGPTVKELPAATHQWLKENKPEALDSKVEKYSWGWEIVWTPPYCPKFEPIELAWGVGK